MKLALTLVFAVVCLSGFAGQAFSQDQAIKKCETDVKGGKYKWAGIGPTGGDPRQLSGFILIKPAEVNRDFLIQLAKRLKSEYCNIDKLTVTIFDNGKYANGYSIKDYYDSNGKIILMRGDYGFDRITGKEVIAFSTKPGGPRNEVVLDLSEQ